MSVEDFAPIAERLVILDPEAVVAHTKCDVHDFSDGIFRLLESEDDQESSPARVALANILALAHSTGLPPAKVSSDEDGGYEIEFRKNKVFADFDVFEDGEIIASTGGKDRQPRSRRIEAYELAATLALFEEHLR